MLNLILVLTKSRVYKTVYSSRLFLSNRHTHKEYFDKNCIKSFLFHHAKSNFPPSLWKTSDFQKSLQKLYYLLRSNTIVNQRQSLHFLFAGSASERSLKWCVSPITASKQTKKVYKNSIIFRLIAQNNEKRQKDKLCNNLVLSKLKKENLGYNPKLFVLL